MGLSEHIVGPLRIGSRGEPVRNVQTALKAMNAPALLVADGRFGKATHGAVVAFQRKKGLKADGVVGPKTAAALGLRYTSSPALLHPKPRRRPPPGTPHGPPSARPPLPHAASSLEIIADGLVVDFRDYFLVLAWEIRRSGGNAEKVTNSVQGLNGVLDDLLRDINVWARGDIGSGTSNSLSMTIIETMNLILGTIGPYLKTHGSDTKGLANRIDRLDTRGIQRAVQGVVDGDKTAETASAEIRVLMDKAMSIAP